LGRAGNLGGMQSLNGTQNRGGLIGQGEPGLGWTGRWVGQCGGHGQIGGLGGVEISGCGGRGLPDGRRIGGRPDPADRMLGRSRSSSSDSATGRAWAGGPATSLGAALTPVGTGATGRAGSGSTTGESGTGRMKGLAGSPTAVSVGVGEPATVAASVGSEASTTRAATVSAYRRVGPDSPPPGPPACPLAPDNPLATPPDNPLATPPDNPLATPLDNLPASPLTNPLGNPPANPLDNLLASPPDNPRVSPLDNLLTNSLESHPPTPRATSAANPAEQARCAPRKWRGAACLPRDATRSPNPRLPLTLTPGSGRGGSWGGYEATGGGSSEVTAARTGSTPVGADRTGSFDDGTDGPDRWGNG
jgi:hypothetical protein